jgi:hypothetical protein
MTMLRLLHIRSRTFRMTYVSMAMPHSDLKVNTASMQGASESSSKARFLP